MRNRDEEVGRPSEPALTTEDLARPAPPADAERESAVFPGEATGGRAGEPARAPGGEPGEDRPFGDRPVEGDRVEGREAEQTTAFGRDGFGQEAGQQSDFAPEPVPRTDRDPEREDEPLLGAAEAERYRTTWHEIQGRFVDNPREAVRSADTLVAEVMQTFAGTLAEHRSGLEKQWDSGEEVATEDLRQALRAYRSLVNRLLDT
ncbi:hypothetical protein ACIRP0_14945 [Streptomyces sp. NPDC101733]|uniref:hypothetical protein n=1 Tax=unclassified Streptomyces TaxID=2593676 RepID=UPI0038003FBE